MNSETIVVCYPVDQPDLRKIEHAFPQSQIILATQESVAEQIHSATVFCGHAKVPVDWNRVCSAGKLKWIQSSAAGLDHCLVEPVVNSDIVVSGCSGLFANQVAEQTMALLYAGVRNLPEFFAAQKKREYVRKHTDDLHGKSVGIVGFGGNGRRIAMLLRHVAGRIVATDCFPEFDRPDYVEVLAASELNRLFECSDVVIVTLPLTSGTLKLIGAEQFSLMNPGSFFVNVARGQVIDHDSLLAAIDCGKITFAGLDVIEPEPLPTESAFWENERVLITPHVGAQSVRRVPTTTNLFCSNAIRFESGGKLINLVDKTLQFPRPEHRLTMDENGKIVFPEI